MWEPAAATAAAWSSKLPVFLDLGLSRSRSRQVRPEFRRLRARNEGGDGSRKASLLEDEAGAFVKTASNADEVLDMLRRRNRVAPSSRDCCKLITAAIYEDKVELAFSILDAMRRRPPGRDQAQWPPADASTYLALVKGLATSLRVSQALHTVGELQRRGVPTSKEVSFGRVVKCPTCRVPLAVVQPLSGIQLEACSKCRYQYELISGDVVNCESDSMSASASAFERGLRLLQLLKRPIPAAVHSLVVRTPDGVARTMKFATDTADIPAQVGERVTIALAAPARQGKAFTSFIARTPGRQPSEPMAATNHVTGLEMYVFGPPPETRKGGLDGSAILPAAILLASGNAATAIIDPTLPRAIAVGAGTAILAGGIANAFVFPRLNQISERKASTLALKQDLLAQYELLQARLADLTKSSMQEVRTLARLCQLKNKMETVGQDIYSARIEKILKIQDGIDQRLGLQLGLIDSYSKIASMIEIEVEVDTGILSSEDASAVASIEAQIQQLMEVEELQMRWKTQAEAADESFWQN